MALVGTDPSIVTESTYVVRGRGVCGNGHKQPVVVDGDPLADISLVAADGKHLRLIMRAGEKNEL
jgi:hypothetical protein